SPLFPYTTLFRSEDDEVAHVALGVRGPVADRDAEHGEGRVAAPVRRHVEPTDLGRVEVRRRRLLRAREQLPPVDDLQGAVGAGAVREIYAVAGHDRSVHALRDRDGPRGTG